MPIDVAVGDFYSELYIDPGAGEHFWGHVMQVDDQGDENTGTTVFTAVDPGEILDYRPARTRTAISPSRRSRPTFRKARR